MLLEPTPVELAASVIARLQPNISPAISVARRQLPPDMVSIGVTPLWSLGASAETIREGGAKHHRIDINLGSWLVLRKKLSGREYAGVRHLPDGRVGSIRVRDGIASLTRIKNGEKDIAWFINEQSSDVLAERVHADVEVCILFMLLHEAAHCIYGHEPPGEAPDMADFAMASEHFADTFALRTLMRGLRVQKVRELFCIPDHRDCNILIATGRAVATVVGALCEQECFREHHISHPPAGDRIGFLVGGTASGLFAGFSDYERDGLVAGMISGMESWPSWYRRTALVSKDVAQHTENVKAVFEYHNAKRTELILAVAKDPPGMAASASESTIRWLRNWLWGSARILFP